MADTCDRDDEMMRSMTTLNEEGSTKFKNGDFDGAMSCYTQALEISEIKETEKVVIFRNRSTCRLKVADFEGAVADATKVLEIAPNDPKALFRRCTAYVNLGKVEDAYRDADMLLKVDPKNPLAKPILNRLYLIIRLKIATVKQEGNEKFENGDFDGALSCYTQALEISEIKDTETAAIFKNRAMCRLKVDDFEGAVSDATKALEIASNDPKAMNSPCKAYASLGKVDDVYRDGVMLIKVASKNPSVESILNLLIPIIRPKMSSTTTLKEEGNTKFKKCDFDGALSCYTQALEISEIKETEEATIFKNRAMCRLKVADFEGAVSDATKALEIAPNDPKAMNSRCTAYASMGKVDEAYRDAVMLIASKNPLVKPMLNRLTSIIRQKEDVFISNVTMTTGEREEDSQKWASQLLSQLCEDVGFSEEEWRLRLRTCDISSTTANYNTEDRKTLFSGSYSEGLAADILGSDIDMMYVLPGIKVTESDVISPDEEDDVCKAVSSNHPAFYIMTLRHIGNGLTQINLDVRNCLERDAHIKMLVLNGTRLKIMSNLPATDLHSVTLQHGPALTAKSTDQAQHEIDLVLSMHCPSWPTVSEEWKHRLKSSGWPSMELVNKVTNLGCEFVPTGNPLSLQNEVEWLLSSSAAERVLIKSFNIVQIQSYFLLKLVLVYLIKPCVPESLCSYHMKNIILWQVEKTDIRVWRKDNLEQCFNDCLKALYQYLENGDLPQYFIPQQNLFKPKIQGEVRRKLIRVVGGLVQEGWICLLRCVPFTNTENDCMHEVPRCPCYIRHMSVQRTLRQGEEVEGQLPLIIEFTWNCLDASTTYCFDQTMSHMKSLQIDTLTDEIYRPSKCCIDILNTAMSNHMGYMMLTVTRGPQGQTNAHNYQILQSAKRQLENNCDVDLSSCRLKLATFYYRLGQVHKCIRVVHDVLEKFTTRTVVCNKNSFRQIRLTQNSRVQQLSGLLSISDDFRDVLRHVSFPILFSAWEIINAPPAVQGLAFHRRFESSDERRNFKVVGIDSQVYAYYLMHICYREIGRPVQAERSLNYLRRMLRRPREYQVYYTHEAQQLLYHCTRSQRY